MDFSTIKEKVLRSGRFFSREKLVTTAIRKTPDRLKKWIINQKIKSFGQLTELEFSPDERKLYAKIMLAGEQEPLEVSILDYQIQRQGTPSLIITRASASRLWLNNLIQSYLLGKELPLPADKLEMISELLEEEKRKTA